MTADSCIPHRLYEIEEGVLVSFCFCVSVFLLVLFVWAQQMKALFDLMLQGHLKQPFDSKVCLFVVSE